MKTPLRRNGNGVQPFRGASGNYTKGGVLGVGASGKVYLCEDNETGDLFAVKELLLHGDGTGTASKMFRREIGMMKSLQHTNIVRYLGAAETSTAVHVYMEYVQGGSISCLLSKLGPFSEHVTRNYATQLCHGLAYLHSKSILHRDIKGGNCLVGTDGVVKLADFGCSMELSKATSVGQGGTSLWMAPEAAKCVHVSLPADIWSVGCTIVEMATGKPPWHDAQFTNDWTAVFFISTVVRGPPIPAGLSRQGHRFLKQCFEVDPDDRPCVSELLKTPFLTVNYVENSVEADMQPPSQDELIPPPVFPHQASKLSSGEATLRDIDDCLSTNTSFTPLTRTAVQETAAGDLLLFEACGGNLLSGLSLPPLPTEPVLCVPVSPVNANKEEEHVAATREEIARYLMKDDTRPKEGHEAITAMLGLPDGVVYNVLFFLNAKLLCRMQECSSMLKYMVARGRQEIVWKQLAQTVLGPATPLRTVLRSNWKQYYIESVRFRDVVVAGQYRIARRLGFSSKVFEATNIDNNTTVIVKIEKKHMRATTKKSAARPYPTDAICAAKTANRWNAAYEYVSEQEKTNLQRKEDRRDQLSLLLHEFRILSDLREAGVTEIVEPLLHGSLPGEPYSTLVTSMAGHSLNEILQYSGNRLQCKTMCLVAVKCLAVLNKLHSNGVIHCNIAPSNIVFEGRELKLVDFSAAWSFKNKKTRRAIPSRISPKIRSREQLYFSSPNIQLECTPAPRDDLLSLGYTLYFLTYGTLPWIESVDLPSQSTRGTLRSMVGLKKSFGAHTRGLVPLQLHHYIKYASGLKTADGPDYPFLCDIFSALLTGKEGQESDEFPW